MNSTKTPFITVYAISKNEEKNVERWCKAALEANKVVVLDTGSTDNTIELLKNNGVEVVSMTIKPWRFDIARNESLKLCPECTDIYVCLDLDETFEPGWADVLRDEYDDNITLYWFSHIVAEKDGEAKKTYLAKRIHSRGYEWIYPVHERLSYLFGKEKTKIITNPKLRIHHHQDLSKDRLQYLSLLEQRDLENPDFDWRGKLLLANTYIIYNYYDKAIVKIYELLERDKINYDNAYYEELGCWYYLVYCYVYLKNTELALECGYKAINIAPNTRAPYVLTAELLLNAKQYKRAVELLEEGINKEEHTWLDSPDLWGYEPWELLASAYYNIGEYSKASESATKALSYEPTNKRLQEILTKYSSSIKTN